MPPALLGRRARGDLAAAALAAIMLQGLGLAGPAILVTLAFSIASFFVGGMAHGAKNVAVRTLLHERVPTHLHGRAYAAYNGLRNAAELIAMLLGGLLVTAVGSRATLLVAGAVPALLGLVCLGRTSASAPGRRPSRPDSGWLLARRLVRLPEVERVPLAVRAAGEPAVAGHRRAVVRLAAELPHLPDRPADVVG